ncbi:hypothetical protein [Rhodopirellula bahusiensis]|uniref:Uncharacterized protein n=1 Tax=Rhodopirellula bahusiensis TaxID=2014065 RepID=A0A2G1W868_9BACT|nr:hypothetical protein [Rhodopirellula bahusiensis]PHQ34829.1 hypothetical protein CEE69_13235 [Rhodopirellula bahusiensis]
MTATKKLKTRRSKKRTDDGKGDRRMKAGKRFRTPGVAGDEADKRFARIDQLWDDNEHFCENDLKQDAQWTPIAIWAAESIRQGEFRVPLPPIDDILASFEESELPILLKLIIDRYTTEDFSCHYPATVDGFQADEAMHIYDVVTEAFPSVNWGLPKPFAEEKVKRHEKNARWSLEQLAKAKNQTQPEPTTPLITGTFHAALTSYEKNRRQEFTEPDGTFDGSGHHFLGIIKAVQERRPDFQLAELDFRKCQDEFDFWRDRPEDRRKNKEGKPLAQKTCQNYVGELWRFFEWLHLSTEFGWRKPQDFSSIKKDVRKLKSDRRSVHDMEIKTFSLGDLKTLYMNAIPFERFLITWGLNCAHGAAEVGRVEWGDLFLAQEHPWKSQGLKVECSEEDNWCGLTRPKSDVIGWWWLWPETVKLLEWWRVESKRRLGRELKQHERILLSETGTPLYRDESRNAQSSFGNTWSRLRKRIAKNNPEATVSDLPFGTLRNQLPDWLGGEQARAIVASVALCHGIPHKGDKLLYRHYANRPWASLFKAQREFRQHLMPMFDSVPDPTSEPDPLGDKVRTLWETGVRKPKQIADSLEISVATVHRRLNELGLREKS